MGQGTPVIGSSVGGIKQRVLDGKTGYLVDPHDVDTVAASMARLLDNPEEAEALGTKGKEHVRRNFLVPELVKKYLALVPILIEESMKESGLRGLVPDEVFGSSKAKRTQAAGKADGFEQVCLSLPVLPMQEDP